MVAVPAPPKSGLALPTVPPSFDASKVDPTSIGETWLKNLNEALHRPEGGTKIDEDAVSALLLADPVPWLKDHLALTWSLRSVHTATKVVDILRTSVSLRKITPFVFQSAELVAPLSTLSFVRVQFAFSTDVAICLGFVNLVPDEEGRWKAWIIFTEMQNLKGHEPDVSRLDAPDAEDVKSASEVEVLIIGAGQGGLQLATALRTLSVPNLIIERAAQVGDHWRRHYDAMKLHLSKWYCQFMYRNWPSSTPFFPTLHDIADFLKSYAESTHVNVLTSTSITQAKYDKVGQKWAVEVVNGDGQKRSISARQLVFASGFTGWTPVIPTVPGKEEYQGTVIHSTAFKNGEAWQGKKAIVVGAGCTAHDISHDLTNYGAQVTMIQRNPTMVFEEKSLRKSLSQNYNENGPPLEVADRLSECLPTDIVRLLMRAGTVSETAKVTEAGLIKAGFRLKDQDLMTTIFVRGGGHYLDIGTSQLIADGKIKVKSGIPISRFTRTGLEFADGSTLDADLVVFSTGFSLQSMRKAAIDIIGEEEGKDLKEVWGLDEEGQVNSVYRYSGHPRLWYCGGTFPMARYYSKMLALQIQGTQLDLIRDRADI